MYSTVLNTLPATKQPIHTTLHAVQPCSKCFYTATLYNGLSAVLSTSLTECDLRGNALGDVGWCAIFDALLEASQSKIAKWELAYQGINPVIATSLAAYLAAASASLRKVLSLCPSPRYRPNASTEHVCACLG